MTESFKSVMLLDTHIKQKERYKMERDMERDKKKWKGMAYAILYKVN